jgi:PAS domain S-box-containing protein
MVAMRLEYGNAEATPGFSGGRMSIGIQLGLVIESLPIALILTGSEGVIQILNREAEIMFGYDRTELQGKSLDLLIPERFRARCLDQRRHFPAAMSSAMVNKGENLFGLCKDGTEFPLEVANPHPSQPNPDGAE